MKNTSRKAYWKERESWAKEAIGFLKPIIPSNWNIRPIWKGKGRLYKRSFKPNALNIYIDFLDEDFFDDCPGKEFLGQVDGQLIFYPVGLFAPVFPPSRRAGKNYPHASFSQINLHLFFLWNLDREGTLVHEMAHIAVYRFLARRLGKKARKDRVLVVPDHNNPHGSLFCKAFQRMIVRTEKIYGKERVKDMRMHLRYFQRKKGEDYKGSKGKRFVSTGED